MRLLRLGREVEGRRWGSSAGSNVEPVAISRGASTLRTHTVINVEAVAAAPGGSTFRPLPSLPSMRGSGPAPAPR